MKESKIPPIEIVKDPEYKVIYVNGVFGGVDPIEGRMIFYVDLLEPEMDEKVPGKMRVGKVVRKLLVDVRMSPNQFVSIAEWMNSHVKRLKKITESEKSLE
ncbi:hypothetical protein [Archaeoglobus profundus]|uniref:Uncharacterized protein n=1 Tax=Archaeoglobus profundus (strain DSM 5631 / JCM 9629 / NBRC 100127 / Av18) TaxID=572546 RepID=D2REJ2_ARCPA|nr:hypothetical protein [Archaeoglobus profundus]ADB58536.1 hypothetical protein Arcpr_1489 [Archaeoglobus profundus DSM 5631]